MVRDKKQKLTGIKELDELEQRINNVEALSFNLRDKMLKQKDDDTSFHAPVFSDLIPLQIVYPHQEFASSSRDTNTTGQAHYGLDVPMQTKDEDPIPLQIVYPHPKITLSSRGTNIIGQTCYDLRSLGPMHKDVVVVKKPYSLVKVTNVVVGLKAPKA
ncbi:hypothetical protein Tco_1137950 [Tanacetum coccineum]